jgi:hypothetical protein
MSCLRLRSRSGVPRAPRKYFVVTMVLALTDQNSGNSTRFWSKIVLPGLPVGLDDVAQLPGHLVIRVHSGSGVDALDRQAFGLARAGGSGACGLGHLVMPSIDECRD